MVATTPGSNSEAVADLTFAMMLALSRRLLANDALLKQGIWDPILGNDLHFKTVGILGLGRVGRAVARRATAFRMNVLGHDPFVHPQEVVEAEVRAVAPDELYRASDFVTLHLPSTPETTGMINAHVLGLMKPSAFLLNTARGSLIDEDALSDALRSGRIAGAGLDVFAREPADPSLPVYQLPNVVVTPHTAGCTDGTTQRRAKACADNIDRFAQGLDLLYRVD